VKVTLVTYYRDDDKDGRFGRAEKQFEKGKQEKGYFEKPNDSEWEWDCDDGDKSVYPGAPETCGDIGVDNNCNGDPNDVDGDETVVDWYLDEDDDGYGDPTTASVKACASKPPKHYVRDNTDECPKNKLRRSDLVCGCEWNGPDMDSDEDGVNDCDDEDFDKQQRLLRLLGSAHADLVELNRKMSDSLAACQRLTQEQPDRAFVEENRNRLGATFDQYLKDVDLVLQKVYIARGLGDFGLHKKKTRELSVSERRDVHCRWLQALEELAKVRQGFETARLLLQQVDNRPSTVNPKQLKDRRLNPTDLDVGWSAETYPDRARCTWVLELLYEEGAIDKEIAKANRLCDDAAKQSGNGSRLP
jgi:hypothetical protein